MKSIEEYKATIQAFADKLGLFFVEKERDFAGRYYFMSLKTGEGYYVSYNPFEETETGERRYKNGFYNAKFDALVPKMANDKWNILAVIYGDDEGTTYEDAVKEFAEWLEKLDNLGVFLASYQVSDQRGGFLTGYSLILPEKTREIKLTSGVVIKDARAIGCGVFIENPPDTQFMELSYSPVMGFYLNLHSCRLDESALPAYKKELEEMSNILVEAKEALDSSIHF